LYDTFDTYTFTIQTIDFTHCFQYKFLMSFSNGVSHVVFEGSFCTWYSIQSSAHSIQWNIHTRGSTEDFHMVIRRGFAPGLKCMICIWCCKNNLPLK
jgi:hypothetical protein